MRAARSPRRVVALAMTAGLLLSGCLIDDVRNLSSDATAGRENGTAGSVVAQDYILGYLDAWTDGIDPTAEGRDAHRQSFDGGTNLIGVLPGTDLADEYVLIGGHYDGLGTSCRRATPDDTICNGATDNATGAAVVISLMRRLYFGPQPRRTVVFAFWDREEDGLLGSQAFVADPPVPLEDIAAYVNFDIQGANLRPSGRAITFAVGAESGGPVLTGAVEAAAASSPLDTRLLSMVFGLGRSDHAVLAASQVPVVFFTDSTGPCYHTVDDEFEVVDQTKLRAQADTAWRLVADLVARDDRPSFTTGLPLATFADAQSVAALLALVGSDRDTFSDADWATFVDLKAVVDDTVAAGPDAFAENMVPMLLAINDVVNLLARADCDGYLEPAG